ncbi:MAG: hypothetical protein FJ149_09285 [Euryarchaeota archaeon]|nr:hypothetical protein [Euryarchaeota archaeon]
MARREADFTERFEPDENPFKVSIAKVQPPRVLEGHAPVDAVLIKLKCLVSMPLADESDRDMFARFCRNLERKKSFCGVFTPEMSEPYYDLEEASVELTGYLRRGMEDRILHLDRVARASHEARKAEAEDELLVEQFMAQLRRGSSLADAVVLAEKETRELISRGRRAESEAETDHLPAPRMDTRVKVHRPPPGPALGRPVDTGPGLPEVQRAEQTGTSGQGGEPVPLVSKAKDGELDADSEVELDINIRRDEAQKKRPPGADQT